MALQYINCGSDTCTHTHIVAVHHLLIRSSETACSTCPVFMAESGKHIAACQTESERI